jgi:anaerobic sulfite reductase subunit B
MDKTFPQRRGKSIPLDNIYLPNPVKVLDIRKHTQTEWSFLLDYKVEEEPGKFVMVSLPYAGEVPISISGFDSRGIELTIRNVGQVTSRIFKLNQGDIIYVRGPYGNSFPLGKFKDEHLLIIAGGSALAAVKPVIECYINGHSSTLRRLDVLAGFRSPKHILFREDIERWKKSRISDKCIDIEVTVDSDEDYAWMGSIGFVVNFIKNVKDIGEDTRAIVIGPPLMMKNSVRELLGCKIKEENIWLSFERHMKCGVGKCGHCRICDKYVCIDGPVFNYTEAKELID